MIKIGVRVLMVWRSGRVVMFSVLLMSGWLLVPCLSGRMTRMLFLLVRVMLIILVPRTRWVVLLTLACPIVVVLLVFSSLAIRRRRVPVVSGISVQSRRVTLLLFLVIICLPRLGRLVII